MLRVVAETRLGPAERARALYGATTDGTQGESRAAAFTRIDSVWPLQVIRYWRSSDATPYTWPLDPTLGGNLPAVVSFETNPAQIINGANDTALVSMFSNMPTDRPIWWCYWHEPEDDISNGTFTVTQYQQAWAHIMPIAQQHAPANAKATFILMGSTYLPSNVGQYYGHPWDWYWPGDVGIQVVGGDDYQFVSPHEASASEILQPHIDAAVSVGLPWGLAEFGAHHSAQDRARFVTDAISIINGGDCEFACYYESWRGSRGPWNLIGVDAAASAAWGQACAGT